MADESAPETNGATGPNAYPALMEIIMLTYRALFKTLMQVAPVGTDEQALRELVTRNAEELLSQHPQKDSLQGFLQVFLSSLNLGPEAET